MRCFPLSILLTLLLPALLRGQEYGFMRYDQKEGLAGSTVNCMAQDKDGFLWFGTETGLSRFDGTHFKNYRQQDGLPDNEIIKLFADSKGRVWISPYRKSICYYYKGKIYNQQNDAVLKKVAIDRLIIRFAEDKQGNILVQETDRLHLIQTNGQVSTVKQINGQPIEDIIAIAAMPEGGFWVVDLNRIYKWFNNQFVLTDSIPDHRQNYLFFVISDNIWIWRHDYYTMKAASMKSKSHFIFNHSLNEHSYSAIDDSIFARCSVNGVLLQNINHPEQVQHLLPNTSVFGVIKDYEGNLWFSTAGQGVYRLNSLDMHNLYASSMTENKAYAHQVTALVKFDTSVLVAANKEVIYRLSVKTGKPEKKVITNDIVGHWPITKICAAGDTLIYATKISLNKMSTDLSKVAHEIAFIYIKEMNVYNNKLYVATNKNLLIFNINKLTVEDTVWREWTTTVYVDKDTEYFGTLNGLYCRYPDKSIVFLGNRFPEFRQRIAGIRKDSTGVLWVATIGAGLLGYKDAHLVARIDQQYGLTSNICRSIFLQKGALWVGTDKGLNKISLTTAGYPIKKYTTGDGLISDFINAIYVEGSNVFVGTEVGVTFFDEQKTDRYSRCDLLFTDIAISGESQQWDSTVMQIPHSKNNIRFDYVAISYKSAGDIRYRYRLLGLDSNWKETRETYLSYPTLPSGEYELQVTAVNKFDVHSRVLKARFVIEELLWEKTWFRVLAGIIFLGITGLLVWFIALRIRKREQEKTAISQRISDLEQLARKAQMNPHFIFNSLNSIQQYVMDSDLAGANKFISGFSRLIRQTLDFSSRQEVSLEEELNYLKNYLELEKDRLEGAFSWEVIVEDHIQAADHYLPPMILQPFVENSVRHGLRFRKDRDGKITIRIKKEHNFLICVIEDNGIGRKAAQRLKSSSHIEYQSKGMSLTAERIAMLNENNEHRITMQIVDLEDEQHVPLGTSVIITFPIT